MNAGPESFPGSRSLDYFTVRLKPGERAKRGLIVANASPYPCAIIVAPAYGKTALDSGDTYPVTGGTPDTCERTGCWLGQLPTTFTLPARGRALVPFTVTVPRGTPVGEYLAGVVAGPAKPPRPGVYSHLAASALVIAHVAIGVAITVPGPLAPKVVVAGVSLSDHRTGVLQVDLHNTGNTWEHLHGSVLVNVGSRTLSFPLATATILPGDTAAINVQLGSIAPGHWPTEIQLAYRAHAERTLWQQTLRFGSIPAIGVPEAAPGQGAPSQQSSLPTWKLALVTTLAALAGALGCAAVVLHRQRRRA